MKKILIMATMALLLVSCGEEVENTPTDTNTGSEVEATNTGTTENNTDVAEDDTSIDLTGEEEEKIENILDID